MHYNRIIETQLWHQDFFLVEIEHSSAMYHQKKKIIHESSKNFRIRSLK